MSARSITPDFAALEIPWDAWSEPYWQAAAEHRLQFPRCADCGTFRWPAGPFCFRCRSQLVEWIEAGPGRIYSFTVLPVPGEGKDAPLQFRAAALAEFDEIPGVRLVSVLIDAPLDAICIGAAIEIGWLTAANATVPVFRLAAI